MTPPTSATSRSSSPTGSYLGMDRFGVDVYPAVRGTRGHGRARCASAGTPRRWCYPTTPLATSMRCPKRRCPSPLPNWHYLHIHNDVHPGAAATRRHRGAARPPCWSTTRAASFDARAAIVTGCRRSRRSAPRSPRWPLPIPTRPRSPATAARSPAPNSTPPPTGWPAPTPNSGVGVGDYVTIAMPNSIEWVQADHRVLEAGRRAAAAVARGCRTPSSRASWSCGPERCSSGEIRSAWRNTERANGFHPRRGLVRRAVARGGVTGVEVDGLGRQHGAAQAHRGRRRQPATGGDRLSARVAAGGRSTLMSVPLSHNTGFTTADRGSAARPPPGADAALRRARVPAAGHRAPRHVPGDGADDHAAAAAGLPRRPGRLRPVVDPAVLASRRAVSARRSSRPGSTLRRTGSRSGNSTAAPNFRR